MKRKSREADVTIKVTLTRVRDAPKGVLSVRLGGMKIAEIVAEDIEDSSWSWFSSKRVDIMDDESFASLEEAITKALQVVHG